MCFLVHSIPPSVVGSFNGGISRPDSANASSDHGSAAAPLMTGGLGVVDPAASQQALVGPTSWQLLFEVGLKLLLKKRFAASKCET